ncbi:hypothetical protein K438DRAFT_1967216 [Mycena galopus ATCC 62051]|nr:hypothetical protein K438DRAFT_1967216 [Mycena galopus ATCC 62051]
MSSSRSKFVRTHVHTDTQRARIIERDNKRTIQPTSHAVGSRLYHERTQVDAPLDALRWPVLKETSPRPAVWMLDLPNSTGEEHRSAPHRKMSRRAPPAPPSAHVSVHPHPSSTNEPLVAGCKSGKLALESPACTPHPHSIYISTPFPQCFSTRTTQLPSPPGPFLFSVSSPGGRGCSPYAKAKVARSRSPRAAVIFVGVTLPRCTPACAPSQLLLQLAPSHAHPRDQFSLSQIASASPRVAPVSKPPRAHPPYRITPIAKRAPCAERVDSARTGSRSQHPCLYALSTAHGTPRLAHGPQADPSSQVVSGVRGVYAMNKSVSVK